MANAKHYKAYRHGKLVASGTSHECAEALGFTWRTVANYAHRASETKDGIRIVADTGSSDGGKSMLEAMRKRRDELMGFNDGWEI